MDGPSRGSGSWDPGMGPKRGQKGVISCVLEKCHSVPESFTSKTPSFGVSFGVSFGSKRVSFGSVLGHFRPGFKWMVRQGGPDHGIQELVQKWVSLCDLPTPKHFMEFSGVNTKIHEIK